MLRRSLFVLVAVTACAEKPAPVPPKKPNNELIVGEFQRKPPAGEQAFRFESDGSYTLAKTRAELEHTPHLGDGHYALEGDQLTFTTDKGQCSETTGAKTGTYKVVISKIGIRFAKVSDECAERSRLDGQTWWRVK